MNVTKFGRKYTNPKLVQLKDELSPITSPPPVGIPDRNPGVRPAARFVPHGGTQIQKLKYSGDQLLGIAAMHKSNLVPIFSTEEARDTAKMRRG